VLTSISPTRPSTAYSTNLTQSSIIKKVGRSPLRRYPKGINRDTCYDIEIKGMKLKSKGIINNSVNCKEFVVDYMTEKSGNKKAYIERRNSLKRPSTSVKDSPVKLKTICSNVSSKYMHPISMTLHKNMLRLCINRRESYARAPLLVFVFEGIIGDYLRDSFFSPNCKLYLKSNLHRWLEIMKKQYQVALITSLSKKRAKYIKAVLELNNVKFDAIYISKTSSLVPYDLIYRDFEIGPLTVTVIAPYCNYDWKQNNILTDCELITRRNNYRYVNNVAPRYRYQTTQR